MQLYMYTCKYKGNFKQSQCIAPTGGRHPENLSELEQRLFYTRVLCSNFSYLYLHLNTPAILANLEEKELIECNEVTLIKMYKEMHAQNVLAIHRMQLIEAPPNCLDKLCDILNTLGQDDISTILLKGKNASIMQWVIFSCLFHIMSLKSMQSCPNMAIHICPTYHSLPLLHAQHLMFYQVPS